MNEKLFKSISFSGVAGIVTGIVVLCVGIAAGIIMIVSSSRLLHDKSGVMF